jgi:ABC-type uncharacterized transport system permease subunit
MFLMTDQNRSFGLIMAAGLGLLAVIRYALAGRLVWWLILPAMIFGAIAVAAPSWLGPVRAAWMKFSGFVGFINSRILLTLVFAAVVVPMAIILRLIGKQPIRSDPQEPATSYWHRRDARDFEPARMERQF